MRSVSLFVVAIVALIASVLPIQSAFAATISLTVAPNPAPDGGGGTHVTFSGKEDPANPGATIYIGIFGNPGCIYEPAITQSTTELSSGAYTLILTTGYIGGVGYYSVIAYDPSTNALSACHSLTITPGSPPSPPTAVGGVVIPANTLAILAPWLAVIAVVGCVGTAVVVAKKRRS